VSERLVDCRECVRDSCTGCPAWAAFECDLCSRETCQDCVRFRHALWVLQGLLEKPELEAVFWP